jgi:HD-GYP domain-containing protein (c-di-GMP phosphodiesterase class II)
MTGQHRNSGLRHAEIIMALSLATDLGTGRPMEWAMRSALLGVRLGETMGLSAQELREVYYCALLVYVGCTADVNLALQLFGDDPATVLASVDLIDKGNPREMLPWMLKHIGAGQPPLQRIRTLAGAGSAISDYMMGHCEVAQLLCERLGFEQSIVDAFSQMYERWDGQGAPRKLKGEEIARPMRIVLLVRDIEAYLNTHGIEAALAVARQRAGSLHDPNIVSLFCDHAEELCAILEQDANWDTLLTNEPMPRFCTDEDFDNAALVMADFIDLISPFFAGHSRNVAALVEDAAKEYGLPQSDIKTLWRAALVHDIGKVAIPHGLWSRPHPLSSSEWERVRLHPYYTERILARPKLLAQLGAIAGSHHEKLDGSGYHRSIRGDTLSPAVRLLAAANYYRAHIEPRPNRDALSPEAIEHEMRQEVRAGRLDSEAVNCVLKAAGHHTTPVRRERVAGLSEREIEVLRLIVRGFSNRQMAQELSVSEKTIGTHIMHIYEKIDCSTRSGATLFAMQHNLVTDFN